jgi:hypothetical protein
MAYFWCAVWVGTYWLEEGKQAPLSNPEGDERCYPSSKSLHPDSIIDIWMCLNVSDLDGSWCGATWSKA